MTFHQSRIFASLAVLAFLSGCSGSTVERGNTVFSVPATPGPIYVPPVSESYVIQRAPIPVQPPLATVYDSYSYRDPVSRSGEYDGENVVEIIAAENARREAEARRSALNELEARANASAAERARQDDEADAMARAEARAAAAEAQAAALAVELAEARSAVAEAEANARDAESAARRAVRERVAELAAERKATRPDRANPRVPDRPVLGQFATRSANPAPEPRAQPAAPRKAVARTAPVPSQAPLPRPVVEQAPIPGLKPYILARSALPSAKPRRAPPNRSFDIATASVLGSPGAASVVPPGVVIPREPGTDLSTQFFPTPGKPSTLGTDLDTPLDVASVDATPYGIGVALGDAVEVDGDSASAEWVDAVNLIESGEVEALAILEDADLVLTLCSGRSILTTPPDLASAATLTAPQIICGQNKPLALR